MHLENKSIRTSSSCTSPTLLHTNKSVNHGLKSETLDEINLNLNPEWFNVSLCLEFGRQWLDQQHVHLPCFGIGEHQLLHRWHHQPQLGTAKGGRPGRGRWAKRTHPSPLCYSVVSVYSTPVNAVVFFFFLIFSAAASLFPEFLGSFLKHSSTAVFELLEDYQTLCQDKVGFGFATSTAQQHLESSLMNWLLGFITHRLSVSIFKVDVLQSVVLRAGQNSKTAGVRWLLQQENCSWRLITSLYRYLSDWRTPLTVWPAVYLSLIDHLSLFLQGSGPVGTGGWYHDRHGCEWQFMRLFQTFKHTDTHF